MPIHVKFTMSGPEASAVLLAHVEERLRLQFGDGFMIPTDGNLCVCLKDRDGPLDFGTGCNVEYDFKF